MPCGATVARHVTPPNQRPPRHPTPSASRANGRHAMPRGPTVCTLLSRADQAMPGLHGTSVPKRAGPCPCRAGPGHRINGLCHASPPCRPLSPSTGWSAGPGRAGMTHLTRAVLCLGQDNSAMPSGWHSWPGLGGHLCVRACVGVCGPFH